MLQKTKKIEIVIKPNSKCYKIKKNLFSNKTQRFKHLQLKISNCERKKSKPQVVTTFKYLQNFDIYNTHKIKLS